MNMKGHRMNRQTLARAVNQLNARCLCRRGWHMDATFKAKPGGAGLRFVRLHANYPGNFSRAWLTMGLDEHRERIPA